MIHPDILEYVRHRLSLRSLKAGLQRATKQYIERNVEFIWVAIIQGGYNSWGLATLHSDNNKIGLTFGYEYKTFITFRKNENGNKIMSYDAEKSTHTFSDGVLVDLAHMQDPVRAALEKLNWLATSDEASVLGEPIDFDLYVSAIGGATIHYSYTEGMEVDASIENLYQAFGKMAYTINTLANKKD
jgi:hypothetical protein